MTIGIAAAAGRVLPPVALAEVTRGTARGMAPRRDGRGESRPAAAESFCPLEVVGETRGASLGTGRTDQEVGPRRSGEG